MSLFFVLGTSQKFSACFISQLSTLKSQEIRELTNNADADANASMFNP